MCVATKNGLYFINEHGKLVNYLNTTNGLYDNIYTICLLIKLIIFGQGLVMACVVSKYHRLTYFNRSYELHGKVTSIIRHANHMYIGTESGLYKLINSHSKVSNFQGILIILFNAINWFLTIHQF